ARVARREKTTRLPGIRQNVHARTSARRDDGFRRRRVRRVLRLRPASQEGGGAGINVTCPLPIVDHKEIVLAHGSGGKLTHRLLEQMILPHFGMTDPHDGATLEVNGTRLAFSTDSFVVNPIFFPGGDIGELAVNGTVNDLAMC